MGAEYFPTAETIWANAALTPTQKLVAMCLLEHRNGDTWKCYPQHDRIMARTGLGRAAVFEALAKLRADGIIWWYKGDKRRSLANEYYFSVDHPKATVEENRSAWWL